MSLESVQAAEAAHLMTTYDRHPVLFRRGRGMVLIDHTGKRYLDFLSGIGVNLLGHGHSAVRRAIRQQSGAMLHISNLFYHDHQSALAEILNRISGLDRVFFTNSGTEAVEGAVKLARAHAKRVGADCKTRFLAISNSFHGRSFAALSLSSQTKHRSAFEPLMPEVEFLIPDDIGDLQARLDDSVCAVVMEPIQGEGGIRPLSTDYLQATRALTKKCGALLILDEVQTGLGRTGKWFAYQHHGILPDIVTIAKPLAAGLPLGAILATDAVAQGFQPGMHGSTFGGGPLACAVSLAVLQAIEDEELLVHAETMGRYLRDRLVEIAAPFPWVREIRGRGLMLGIEVDSADRAKAIVAACLAHGLIINRTHDTVLRLLPPLIVQKRHIDPAIRILKKQFATHGGPSC